MNALSSARLPIVEDWLGELSLRCLPTTARDYRLVALQFDRWLDERPITAHTLVDYRWWLQRDREPPLSSVRIRLTFTVLRSYLGYRRTHGEPELPDGKAVPLPRRTYGQRVCPSAEDVQALFDAARRLPQTTLYERMQRARDLAVLAVLANNGLRRAELLALETRDVLDHSEEVSLRIRVGKGGKFAVVPVVGETLQLLGDYRRVRREYLGTGITSQPGLWLIGPQRVLSHAGLDAMMKRLASSAAVKRCTPHQLRHYFGTAVLRVSDIATAMLALRHTRLSTTTVYLHSDDRRVDAALLAIASPHWRATDGRKHLEQPHPRLVNPPARPALPTDSRAPGDSTPGESVREAHLSRLTRRSVRRQSTPVGT